MDAWFEQRDIEKWIRAVIFRPGILLPVYRLNQFANQRDFMILLGVRKKHYQSSLNDALFNDDTRQDHIKLYVQKSVGVFPLRRLWNAASRCGQLVRMRDGIILAQTRGYMAKFNTIQAPTSRIESVEVEWSLLAADCARKHRYPLLCFESLRFSEKTLSQLHVRAMEKTWTTEAFTYRKKICDLRDGWGRMNSLCQVIGKIKCCQTPGKALAPTRLSNAL